MAKITVTTVRTRPSVDVDFTDYAASKDWNVDVGKLQIDWTCTYSADALTVTRTMTYDESVQPALDALKATHAAVIQADADRRTAAGVTTTIETTTA